MTWCPSNRPLIELRPIRANDTTTLCSRPISDRVQNSSWPTTQGAFILQRREEGSANAIETKAFFFFLWQFHNRGRMRAIAGRREIRGNRGSLPRFAGGLTGIGVSGEIGYVLDDTGKKVIKVYCKICSKYSEKIRSQLSGQA